MFRRKFLAGSVVFLAVPARAASRMTSITSSYEEATGGHIGVFARNLATGQRLTWRENERFVMCSTFKASLAALTLLRVDQGKESLETVVPYTASDLGDTYAPVAKANVAAGGLSVRAMCQAAVEWSDNVCANLLLARVGGPAALTRFWRSLGDRQTRLDDWEPVLNRTPQGGLRNTTTPEAMAWILEHLVFGHALSGASCSLLTGWMKNCQTGKGRLRAGFPPTWDVGDKTGNNGKDAAGDIAVAWPTREAPLIVCAYTRGGQPDEKQFFEVFSEIGRIAAETLCPA
ncbi:beta-lactamase [Gluconobacter japonicus]|uniref:Beta-lactamase n=2 Tax=Gluconobacter japonicus TaxID=376620 RepID=A0A9Q2FNU5_GLUJA|nr:beta-lactamase [Gluconobacter japonicus]MBF0871990.1 class A beta-lactamase [Gluconobacter japonicus]